ncbi:hypothetical protein F4780DRAFT_127665 [Xylariomycetidae sp. FL0641]|nr:hypothetical protein F4780DRAFT_127665 [Xylariomycetidae sp. FL0641]
MADPTLNHDNRGPQLLAVDYSFLVISIISMSLRVYVRCFMVKKFGLDDWTMLFATIIFILYTICSVNGVAHGTGQHRWDLTAAQDAQAKEYWWFCYLTYSSSMIMSKASIGLFLLRVAVKKAHIWIIWIAMSITVVTCLAFFFVTIFQCHPVSYFWDKYSQSGTCVDENVVVGLAYLYSICAILTDFTFALLPAWIISQLKMKVRTKLALIPLMAMGCVASGAVIVRCAYLVKIRSPDFLYDTTDVAIWSTIEEGLAISAGSFATLRPLFKLLGYKLGFTSSPHSTADYGKMSGTGPMSRTGGRGRRRPSQSVKLATFTDTTAGGEDRFDQLNAYEVRCEAGGFDKYGSGLPGGISHGRTVEISTEFVDPEKRTGTTSPLSKPSSAWMKSSGRGTNSVEILRTETSIETLDNGGKRAEPRSFLQGNSEGR